MKCVDSGREWDLREGEERRNRVAKKGGVEVEGVIEEKRERLSKG